MEADNALGTVLDPYPSQSSARSDSSVPISQIQATLDKYAMPPPVQDVAAASEDMQPSTLEILCELGEENFETQQEEEDIPSGQAWQEYPWNEFDIANADTLMDNDDSQSHDNEHLRKASSSTLADEAETCEADVALVVGQGSENPEINESKIGRYKVAIENYAEEKGLDVSEITEDDIKNSECSELIIDG